MWLSLVERYVRDVEVASSNLVTSTKIGFESNLKAFFSLPTATQILRADRLGQPSVR